MSVSKSNQSDAEFEQLIQELSNASQHYYQSGQDSNLSDEEYDAKKDYLIRLAEDDPSLITDEYLALTQEVADGTKPTKRERTVGHKTPMLSLQKAKTLGEVTDFLEKTAKFGALENGWVIQLKLDGSALSAVYKNGQLTQLATRGNGQNGEDITAFVHYPNAHIEGLPRRLEGGLAQSSFEVRGEIFMSIEQFQRTDAGYYALHKQQNDKETVRVKKTEEQMHFSKPRNAGAGVLKPNDAGRYEFEYSAYLSFYVYGVLGAGEKDFPAGSDFTSVQSVTEMILAEQGLSARCRKVQDVLDGIETIGRIQEYVNSLAENDQNKTRVIRFAGQAIPIDGVVIKCFDDAKISALMGSTSHHPSSQLAYKFESEDATTVVEDIEINVGRTGRMSLRAKVSPVVLDGSNVEYATLHNFDWALQKDVRIGSKVSITLANDIIPYVKAVLFNPPESVRLEVPDTCPLCDFELDKRTLLYRCPNDNCPSRGIKALEQAVGKNFFNIDGLSTRTLQSLYDAGLVRDIGDVFHLTQDDLSSLATGEVYQSNSREHSKGEAVKLGARTAQRIYNSIQTAKQAPLEKVLSSLNIPYLGRSLGRNLAKRYRDIDEIIALSPEELESVELVSVVKSSIIHKALQKRLGLIDKMRAAGVNFTSNLAGSNDADGDAQALGGQIVVISGSIPGYNRDEARDLVERLGGASTGSVTSKTTLLIADAGSSSSKVLKAQQLGVRILAPEDFLQQYVQGGS